MDFQKLKEKFRSFMKGSDNNSPDPEKGVIVPSKTERMVDDFTRVDIYSPAAGTVIDQKDIPDETFAEGHMGQGVGIDPTVGDFHAFVDGTVEVVFKTKHAYIMKPSDTDLSILLHIGIDTVKIPEELHAFECKCHQGDSLKHGDHLCFANLEIIKEKAKSTITPILVQNENMESRKVIYHKKPGEQVAINELLMSIVPVK